MIGVLALQGSVAEHTQMLRDCVVDVCEVRTAADLKHLSGIIFPGGESTAIGKLLHQQGLYAPLRKMITNGLPTWGTCAGAILLAKKGSEYSLNVANFAVAEKWLWKATELFCIRY